MSGITYEEYYKIINDDCQAILIKSLHSKAGIAFKANHNYLVDMEKWVEVLSSRPEINVLKGALREYHFALLVILQGHYRQAFMSLRLFMELYLS